MVKDTDRISTCICNKWTTIRWWPLWRWVPLVEQERLTVPGHLSSPPVLSGVRVAQSLFLCFVVCRSLFALLSFFISQMAIVLSGLLRFTYSDYPFDIFKLFYPRKTQIKIKKESERSSIWVLEVSVLPLYMICYGSLEQVISLWGPVSCTLPKIQIQNFTSEYMKLNLH